MYPMTNTKRITGQLPRPTLEQRLAGMSEVDLMIAARGLAKQTELAEQELCTRVLETLEQRVSDPVLFEAFVAEIYS